MLQQQIENAWQVAFESLVSQSRGGHWTGELSTSALSTATAISALSLSRRHRCLPADVSGDIDQVLRMGCQWLAKHQNADGGFGDTDRSHSNVATSLLVQAAWQLADFSAEVPQRCQGVVQYIESMGKWDALRRRYGTDKTFVVPILTNCALAGLVEWNQVPALPFEAAWLPQAWYRLARMPVVSYAVPALVAIGQAKFHFQPPKNPFLISLRLKAIEPTLRVLRNMQPESGGYLEAVPLTSFVLMSLAAMGRGGLSVAQNCIRFLLESRLPDGSWPIDTNLATWLTSLTITALHRRSKTPLKVVLSEGDNRPKCDELSVTDQTVRWLLSCQHKRRHPFTGASPGGWGWTDLSGAVPDADDTPAALLALASMDLSSPDLSRLKHQTALAVAAGLRWLVELQNRNGGWPTFCRGWGKLPFDRSGTDLTAHALRAMHAWSPEIDQLRCQSAQTPTERQIDRAIGRGFRYLRKHQQADGSWLPLWFGNQDRPAEDNPVYGTSKVLLAYADFDAVSQPEAQRGLQYLLGSQNADGGWGGGSSVRYRPNSVPPSAPCSSIEETALSLEALIQCGGVKMYKATIMRGLRWLAETVTGDNLQCSQPIGFYFAKLWYHEKLYPAVFGLGALGAALRVLDCNEIEAIDRELCMPGVPDRLR